MSMRAERFKQIDDLFAAVLERDSAERAAFLSVACHNDEELRREVESLLAAHECAGDFIESSALELSARAEAHWTIGEVGKVIGPYQIQSLLAAGGMGNVYLAVDIRLRRQVAIKLLPFEFTRDASRVDRFELEARAASALNHPNIVTIYDIGQSEQRHFIAAEFVEGSTFRELISGAQMKVEEIVRVALQIAEALSAAHAAGITHRDIKPENIMLRPDGYVKLLDFGIAKLTERGSSIDPATDSLAANHTEPGGVIGTVAYMSPEQALGWEVDQRTDIFSFGVVLYELLARRHPFRGATNAATFEAILHRDALAAIPTGESTSELERIVRRALEKDRELRYQTVRDMRAELKVLQRGLDSSAAFSTLETAPTRRRAGSVWNHRTALALNSLLLVAALGVYVVVRLTHSRPPPQTTPGNLTFTQVTDSPGQEIYPGLSPDGKVLVYAGQASGNWDIYWQRIGGRNPRNLTADSTADDTQPAFSPDGEHIAFRSEREKGGIFIMGATGESPRRLTDFGYYPAWSPSGHEIAFSTEKVQDPNVRRPVDSVIWIVDVANGQLRKLAEGKIGDAAQPQWSPTGARLAYWGRHKGGQRDIWTIPAQGGDPVQVTDDAAFDWNPVWAPDGKSIYFASDRGGSMNLWHVPIEEQTGHLTGPFEPFTTPSPFGQQLAFSHDGRLAVYVNLVSSTNIYTAGFNPYKEAITAPPVAITQGFKHALTPDLSPDGEWFVYSSQGEKQEDIYLIRRDGAESPRKLTDDAYRDRNPRWSPDGSLISFYSDRSGAYEAWTVRPDGSGLKQITFAGEGLAYPFWSPDGARLAYNRKNESCSIIEMATAWNEQQPLRIPDPADKRLGAFWAISWSPDGRKLGGWSSPANESPGIVVYSFETGAFDRVAEFGSNPVWLKDNRRLLFTYQGKLYLVNTETRKTHEISLPLQSGVRFDGYGLSTDNRMIYYGLTTKEADVWLLSLDR
jgi:Tol biopolymer transport system component/serine/threonine protein kinase